MVPSASNTAADSVLELRCCDSEIPKKSSSSMVVWRSLALQLLRLLMAAHQHAAEFYVRFYFMANRPSAEKSTCVNPTFDIVSSH